MNNGWLRGEKVWSLGFLHVYSITMFLGVLFSFLAIAIFWKRQKYSWEHLLMLLIIIVPTSIFGARIWFLIWDGGWSNFFTFQGLSIHGGVLFSTIAASTYVFFRRNTLDYKTVISIILPNVMLGQVIGRWGNFANHEVFGSLISNNINDSTLNWMGDMKSHMWIRLNDGEAPGYRQPLFFYEFLANGFGWIMMVPILLRKNWLKPGVLAGGYLFWYGLVRVSMEQLRDEVDIMGKVAGGFKISVFIASLSLVFGLWLIIYWQWLCQPMKKYFIKKNENFLNKKNENQNKWYEFKKWFYKTLTIIFGATNYEKIMPIKPRKENFFFGKETDYKKQFIFWGKEIENKVIIWLPTKENDTKLSKRELNKQ